jgi:hypothetical protein
MKPVLLLLVFFIPVFLFAQDDGVYKEASKESQAYHKYRVHLSYPPYSLEKINGLIRKQVVADSEDNLVLKEKAYTSFSLREQFTYNMIHGESFSQNCDAMPPIQDEQKKIFSYLPDAFDEFAWSERQVNFFTGKRDSVIYLMKECISKNNRVGVNFKHAIMEINAREMIPFLIKTYTTTKKDHDILTVFMLLMKENKYAPFLSSASCKKLYGDNSNYQDFLLFNKANEDLIIKRATDFYNESKN